MTALTYSTQGGEMTERIQGQSEPVENFLKAVYTLESQDQADATPTIQRVSTNTLSEVLNITAPSVTDMAQRLVSAGLIDYKKYHGVLLTPAGRDIALRVIRRHRLIELYLVRELNYALHEVHDEAERLEHAVSDRFIEALANKLGNPTFDPHGDPIPTAEGTVQVRDLLALTDLPLDTPAAVSQLKATDPEMLQFILDKGFELGEMVEVTAREPFEGPVTVWVGGAERVIGVSVAACIWVERA